jgi:hypothetical protein
LAKKPTYQGVRVTNPLREKRGVSLKDRRFDKTNFFCA